MPEVAGRQVGAIGYGLMGLSWRSTPPPLDRALEVMRAAVKAGCTFRNGADFYGTKEYNSMTLVKHYFTKYPEDVDKVTLFIKGGGNPVKLLPDGSPENARRLIDNILDQIGGIKKIDGFAYARRDPNVPLEVTFGVIQKEYVDTGKIGGIYLSEVRAETIHEAVKHAKIPAAEVELSIFSAEILKNGVVDACAQHDIPIMAYSPIGRGAGALQHNLKMVEKVEALAKRKGCTPAQYAISWVKCLSNRPGLPLIVTIPGATTPARINLIGRRYPDEPYGYLIGGTGTRRSIIIALAYSLGCG